MLKPLFNRVLIQQIEATEISRGGVHLPQNKVEKPQEGQVLSIGPDVTGVKVGEFVVFSKYAGHNVDVDGRIYLIINEADIMAVRA